GVEPRLALAVDHLAFRAQLAERLASRGQFRGAGGLARILDRAAGGRELAAAAGALEDGVHLVQIERDGPGAVRAVRRRPRVGSPAPPQCRIPSSSAPMARSAWSSSSGLGTGSRRYVSPVCSSRRTRDAAPVPAPPSREAPAICCNSAIPAWSSPP